MKPILSRKNPRTGAWEIVHVSMKTFTFGKDFKTPKKKKKKKKW